MAESRRTRNTMTLPGPAVVAPDGSKILELLETAGASLVRCELPRGGVSLAVRHRTVEELWYFLEGHGEVWRQYPDGREEVVEVRPHTCLRIPTGAAFQFRDTGAGVLAFLIVTLPPWPGDGEAVRVADHWPTVADGDRTL
jgi:mannose-6-phosphate isomerase-like protein (cupin superfamily)